MDAAAALPASAVVGVIGAGSMGAGIAQVAAAAGHPVLLHDAQPGAVPRALAAIAADLRRQVERGRLSAAAADATIARLRAADPAEPASGWGDCALAIEAIIENLEIKRALLGQLAAVMPATAILASNTSSLSITALAAGLAQPQRVVGMHFFNPAPRMRLVEVVSGLQTDAAVAATVAATAAAWGKAPVHARSTPGFIVNRIARPFYGEAWRVYSEARGGSPELAATLDAIVRDCGGFPMGPFELMDLIGHDVNLAVSTAVFEATFGERRYAPSLAQQELVRAGRLGRKSGRGVYDYAAQAPQPAVHEEAGAEPVALVTVVGSLGPATPLLARLEAGGVEVRRVEGRPGAAGWLEIGTARLQLTDGRPATRRAMEEGVPHLVLFDLALDYATTPRLALTRADSCGEAALRSVCATLGRAGLRCTPIDDLAGMIVLRTVAMLINEAADAILYGVCTAEAIDTAMRHGVNYPRGPLAWSEQIGLAYFAQALAKLREHYGEERYRTSALIQRLGYTGAGFHG